MFSKKELYKFGLVIGLIIVLLVVWAALEALQGPAPAISSFEDCARAGNSVMESYPRQCRTEDGRLFVEEVDEPIEVPEEGDRDIPSENDREDENGRDTDNVRTPGAYDGCVITGCSSQVCADEEVATTCEYQPQYACYDSAICERQPEGECGWTQTPESQSCFADFR